MRRSEQPFRLPNRPMTDNALSYTARCLCAAIYSLRNPLGLCCNRSIAELSALAGCTVQTTVKNIRDLEKRGYISHINTRRFDEVLGHMVYSENIYICLEDVSADYTLVPREVLALGIKAGTLVVLLYLYLRAGNEYRGYPSLAEIAEGLHMGKSTVCRVLAKLERERIIYREHCINTNGSYSANSYFLLQRAAEPAEQPSELDMDAVQPGAANSGSAPLAGRVDPISPTHVTSPLIWYWPPQNRWRPPFGWG